MADQEEEQPADAEPDPPDLRQLTADLRQLTAIVSEQSDALQDYRQENLGLQQEIANLRTSSPANINDEKKFTKLVATSVTEALTAGTLSLQVTAKIKDFFAKHTAIQSTGPQLGLRHVLSY